MVHLEIKEASTTDLKVHNTPLTAHLLSTLPKECHGLLFDAVALVLREYDETEKVDILEGIVKNSEKTLSADAAADRAIRQSLQRIGAAPVQWEVLE